MAEKQPAFVVVDRRKFTAEGEIRDTYTPPGEEKAVVAPKPPAIEPPRILEYREPDAQKPVEMDAGDRKPVGHQTSAAGRAAAEAAASPNGIAMPTRSTVEAEAPEASPELRELDSLAASETMPGAVSGTASGAAAEQDAGPESMAQEAEVGREAPFLYPEADGNEQEQEASTPAPTAAETAAQNDAYQRSAREMDWLFRQANPGMKASAPVGFEHIVQSFYMSAIMAMGAGTEPGQKPRIDILGARQAIDMLSVLADKTRGNLDEKEQQLVDGVAFELRMMFLELTNAIAAQAQQAPGRR